MIFKHCVEFYTPLPPSSEDYYNNCYYDICKDPHFHIWQVSHSVLCLFCVFVKKIVPFFKKIGKCPLLYFVMIFVVVDIAEYPSVPYRFGKRGSVQCYVTQQRVIRAGRVFFIWLKRGRSLFMASMRPSIHT